jgi:hypothetical protein
LLARISAAVKPSDTIEEIWVRNIVDFTWECFRWRRLKTSLLADTVPNELEDALEHLVRKRSTVEEDTEHLPKLNSDFATSPPSRQRKLANKLVKKWAARDPAAIERVNKLLASANKTIDTVMARVFVESFDEIDRIDRSITTTEARRNAVLREIDRRRTALAQALRQTLHEAEEAEFEIVKPKKMNLRTRIRRMLRD